LLELIDLVDGLRRDPASRLQAALAGWEYPVTREWLALVDLFDLQHKVAAKNKPQPYARPFDRARNRIGGVKKAGHTVNELRELLARPRVEKT
jgi:hypothetical protein